MSTIGEINAIMKKLLSTPPQKTHTGHSSKMINVLKNFPRDEDYIVGTKLSSYLEQICGQSGFINTVELDHNYSKPWNWRQDNTYAKPMKSLFINKLPYTNQSGNDEIIDPVGDTSPPKPAYDEEKARKLMDDPLRQIRLLRTEVGDIDWEITVDKSEWSIHQKKLFERGARILQFDRLSRLSYSSNWNEPVLRKLSVERAAKRLRTLFATFGWQYQLLRWLHCLWLDILHHDYLVAYVEILQTLKKKVPTLIDRLLLGVPQSTKVNPDVLFMMVQSSWDPASIALPCHLPRRLPGNPLLLIIPCGSVNSNAPNSRLQRWQSHLSAIGTVVLVNTNKLNTSKVTVTNSLEHLMSSTRAKIAELKSDYIGRNIVLIGFNSGAALACQISLVEPVSAVVCLGFPMNTVEEKRGQPDDSILNLNVPTLFVIGRHAATAHVNDMEDLRERLRVHTSLVVVGAADDYLRVSHGKKVADGMTQTMVDRCIVDEVEDFIGSALATTSHKQDIRTINSKSKMKMLERKRKVSMNEELIPKKNRITLTPAQTGIALSMNALNRQRKNAPSRNNVGRPAKWTNETDGRIQTISRKATVDDASNLLTRSTIDSIRIINKNITFKQSTISGETEDGEPYNILSEIKVLGGEEGENFVGQLTADRLLDMPVIIAQEDTGTIGNTLSGNSASHQSVKVMVTSGSRIMREDTGIIVKDTTEIRPTSIRCIPAPNNKTTSTIHIGRTATKNIQNTTIINSKNQDNNIQSGTTKCTTIFLRDQPTNISPHAQLHKMDIIPRNINNTTEATIRRRNFTTQFVSRSRPPRIKNIPAVKHSRSNLPSPISD